MRTCYVIDDLPLKDLRAEYFQRTGHRITEKDFVSFGLMSDDGALTDAGLLMCDECPLQHVRLRCTRWDGLHKGYEIRQTEEIRGGLLSQLHFGMRFVQSWTGRRRVMLDSGALDVPEYPERAVLEALVNALIHRDYAEASGNVRIDIFDDRIEICSPGGLYGGGQVEELKAEHVPSRRRNPLIADLFHRLHYAERRGSGLPRIREAYRSSVVYTEQMEPIFHATTSSFTATLWNLHYAATGRSMRQDRTEAADGIGVEHMSAAGCTEHVTTEATTMGTGGAASDGAKSAQGTAHAAPAGEMSAQGTAEPAPASEEMTKQSSDGRYARDEATGAGQNLVYVSPQSSALIDKLLQTDCSAQTIRHAVQLLATFGHDNWFTRAGAMEVCGLARSATTRLLRIMSDCGLIAPSEDDRRGQYRFIRP